jgi:hypothetical protein
VYNILIKKPVHIGINLVYSVIKKEMVLEKDKLEGKQLGSDGV